MHPPIPVAVFFSIALAASSVHAATDLHPLQPSAPRTVIVAEAETPPQVRAGVLQSTLIVLPTEEKVANVFAGDTVNWVFDGGHVASRFISVKPKTANAATDIHIVSDHGNEYTLQRPFYPRIPLQLHSHQLAYFYSATLAYFCSALDMTDYAAVLVSKKWVFVAFRYLVVSGTVFAKYGQQRIRERDEPVFVELCLPDNEDAIVKISVAESKPKSLGYLAHKLSFQVPNSN